MASGHESAAVLDVPRALALVILSLRVGLDHFGTANGA